MKIWTLLSFFSFGIKLSWGSEFEINDEEYYKLPDLFTLDNYEKCLSQRNGVYCLGTFELTGQDSTSLFNKLKEISAKPLKFFNHTKIHRGVCLTEAGKCNLANKSLSWESTFEKCVNHDMVTNYDLNANLELLNYCKDGSHSRKFDMFDYLFIIYGAIIIILNLFGTWYDTDKDNGSASGPSWLLAFSLKANWTRLTRGVDRSNQSFMCFHFIKASVILIVHVAHATMAIIMAFPPNPRFIELAGSEPELAVFYNGAVLIQTYIVTTSFFRTLKTFSEADIKTHDFNSILESVAARIVRIMPSFLTMVAFCSTIMPYLGDGPLWKKHVEDEADSCRDSFWSHFLLLQNFFPPGCLGQTWYLSVDFQIYLATTLVTVYLARKGRNILRCLLTLIIGSLGGLYAIVSYFDLQPLSMVLTPENLYSTFKHEKSFHLLYQTFWGNFPSGLVGISTCMIYFKLKNCKNIGQNKHFNALCRLSVIIGLLYITIGLGPMLPKTRHFVTLYATVDKFIFAVITAVFILGCIFCDIGGSFMKWHGWVVVSRLSLSSLLIHVVVNRVLVAGRLFSLNASYLNILSDGVSVSVLTMVSSIPLCLMVEYPAMELFQFIQKKKNMADNQGDIKSNKTKTM